MAEKKEQKKEQKKEKKYVNSVLAWCLLAAEVIIIAVIALIVFL